MDKEKASYTARGKLRKNITRACDECKITKRKCDGARPCTRCVQQRLICEYKAPYRRGIIGRVQILESAAASEDGIIQEREANWVNETSPIDVVADKAPPESVEEDEEDDIYLGKASGITFFRNIKQRLLESHSLSSGSSLSFTDQKFHQAAATPIILPPIETSHHLIDQYFEFSSPTYRFLHKPSVLHSLKVLYEDYERSSIDPATFAIVFMCCAWGANSSTEMQGPHTGDIASERFYKAAKQQLDTVQTNTLPALQAHFMICSYLLFSSRINQAWAMMGIIVRQAQAIGLHRKTHHRSILQNELGKRTFWCIYILDRYLSVILGRPCALHDDDIDQDLPGNFDDSQLSYDSLTVHQEGEYREMMAPISHIKLAIIMSRILKEFYGAKNHNNKSQVSPDAIIRELLEWKQSLPSYLEKDKVPSSSLPLKFRRQQEILHLAYSHALMLLYRPFIINYPGESQNGIRRNNYDIECVKVAFDAVKIITATGKKQHIATAFWFETYIGFCSVVVIYVYVILHPDQHDRYFPLAESCQQMIANSALENVISSRYVLIMEELRKEVVNRSSAEALIQEMEITDWLEFDGLLDLADPSEFSNDLFRSIVI